MLAMLMVFLLLYELSSFLVHLLVNHYSWSYYTRNQWIHRTHARARWWIWRVGTWGAGILDILAVAQDDKLRAGFAVLLGEWEKGLERREGCRWWMGRIAASRIPSVRRVWIWSWLPSIGIPHVQMFPSAQEWRKKED